ncbi:MAG: NUDIX domain-containing protein [Planctomycetes bacterium]|nr:NUDIX domain-containing protein [Planctomycetota bacterium]
MPAEKRVKSKTLYRGKVINLRIDTVELPNGSRTEREIVEHSEVVHILAVDTDDRVLLVRQFRTPAGRELLETPAGGIRPGESPEGAAQRELREETGFRAGALELVYSFYSTPGFCTEFNHLFFATDLTYDPLEGDDDEEELEKPEEPTPDRKSDVLLRAIDHEMPVRITAHRSADILNALALADEFNLDIIIEGATEARFVADQLAEARVPVVLGPTHRTVSYENNEFRRHARNTGDALSEAGVQWTVTSGGQSPAAARFIGMNAQLAAAHNRKTSDWMALVTTGAAKILGLPSGSGRLVRGGQADFVVWSGDPSDPSSRVEQVYVAGKLAYKAKQTNMPNGGGR